MMYSKILSRFIQFLVTGLVLPTLCLADLTVTSPTSGTDSVEPCKDYFRHEWNEELSMSDRAHGPLDDFYNQSRAINGFTYAGGILSFTTTAGGAPLTLLQYTALGPQGEPGAIPVHRYGEEHPIDSATYTHLNVRMYASAQTIATVSWSIDINTYATTLFTAYQGWHVYDINLSTATINTSAGSNVNWSQRSWEGFEIFPANASGVTLQVDWIQLVAPSTCGSFNVGYSVTGTGSANRLGLAIDTNTDPSDGVVDSAEIALTGDGAGTATLRGDGTGTFNMNKLLPGDYHVYGVQSPDWATVKLLDAWDMSESSDIDTSLTSGVSGGTFAGGQYSGSFSNADPSIYLRVPRGTSIDATVYRYLTVRLTLSGLSSSNSLQVLFFNTSGALLGTSPLATVNNGTQTVEIDLAGAAGWSGSTIGYFRIDPVSNALVSFSIDFVSLSSNGYVGALSAPTFVEASTTLHVGNPSLTFIQPDEEGGIDFAQSVIGDPWNMNSKDDIDNFTNVESASIFPHGSLTDPDGNAIEGDFLRAYNVSGDGDPQYVPHYFDKTHLIDTSRFVNLCFAGWNKTETNNFNSVIRAIWHNSTSDGSSGYSDGDDLIGWSRYGKYCLDLRSTADTRVEPPLAEGAPNPWTSLSAGVDLLRIDMNESTDSNYHSIIDYIHLRADHEANSQYAIVVDAALSQAVDLYRNSTASTTGGTAIGTLAAGRNSNIYLWDTSGLSNGTYYVYGSVTKNGATVKRLAGGRLVVDHARSQDTTDPILVCERPGNGYTFDNSLELAGYALDDTRLATVELFVDNTWIQRITPQKFHLAARDAYTTLAESNNPGFQEFVDGTSFGYGAHTVRMVATDTAGNDTSCEHTVTRVISGDTAPYTYPTPSGEELAFDVGFVAPDPKFTFKIKGNKLTVKATSLGSCGTLRFNVAESKDAASYTTFYTAIPSSTTHSQTFTIRRYAKKNNAESPFAYLNVGCSSGAADVSPTRKVDLTKTSKSTKKAKKGVSAWITSLDRDN